MYLQSIHHVTRKSRYLIGKKDTWPFKLKSVVVSYDFELLKAVGLGK